MKILEINICEMSGIQDRWVLRSSVVICSTQIESPIHCISTPFRVSLLSPEQMTILAGAAIQMNIIAFTLE